MAAHAPAGCRFPAPHSYKQTMYGYFALYFFIIRIKIVFGIQACSRRHGGAAAREIRGRIEALYGGFL